MEIKKGIYRHYKNKDYEVFFVALHSETLEPLVVYRALHENEKSDYWVRPYSNFTEEIIHEGKRVPRFRYLDPVGEQPGQLMEDIVVNRIFL